PAAEVRQDGQDLARSHRPTATVTVGRSPRFPMPPSQSSRIEQQHMTARDHVNLQPDLDRCSGFRVGVVGDKAWRTDV
ncbi:MAG: hypothetical protein FWC46_09275, partial [Actinomycetia bacterium]|nr:hypothetical protein [Actinomycetes bacterium]